NDLSGWDFSDQNLSGARFNSANLEGASLANANVLAASFERVKNFTAEQLYSTRSYREGQLQDVVLCTLDLSSWDFSSLSLEGADFSRANLTNTDFSDANIKGTSFSNTTYGRGFTFAQLASTGSYKSKDLYGVSLEGNDLTGWDFSEQDLTFADLGTTVLKRAHFAESRIDRARLYDLTRSGFTAEQLYETVNYKEGDLAGIILDKNDLSGWDLSNQRLVGTSIQRVTLDQTDLRGANLSGAIIHLSDTTRFDETTQYNQWTDFGKFSSPPSSMTFVESAVGDFDANGKLDINDVNMIHDHIIRYRYGWLRDMFDVSPMSRPELDKLGVSGVDRSDVHHWVRELKGTWIGDANLDGEFDASDLVLVFAANEYEDDIIGNSTWQTGDWNIDGEFDSGDLVIAFADGGYGKRSRVGIVPEPKTSLAFLALLTLMLRGAVVARICR
ncbi:MAG: pentapeptide repeat-containing protein, partial [Planctomycetales bacterium]|nr:pentapeptide repeat-containing protein [Planctomycetales bacterium]